jgi:hypothetical protein
MLRSLGISLLMLGLLAAGYDGFRQREHVQSGAATGSSAVRTADNAVLPPT